MLTLNPIDRRTGLTKASFKEEYLDSHTPVIFTDLTKDWPAREKWTLSYFKEAYGHLQVPVYSNKYAKPGKKYLDPDQSIPFKEFLETIEEGPTSLRMFLFNIFKHAPELCHDFSNPNIMNGFIKGFPFMFFGGEGSKVGLHYDIDLSHVFLNQFHGRKRVVLFHQDQSVNIYQHPFTVASFVDISNPNYEEYPALRNVEGLECILEPGETLFMPSGYWHYIEYLESSFSISLRANDSIARRAKGALYIARHFVVDRGMNKVMGQNWRELKINIAKKRANERMKLVRVGSK